MNAQTLIIGSGQTGTTLVNELTQKYWKDCTSLFFNSNDDVATIPNLIKLRVGKEFAGSGRDLTYVSEVIIPQNETLIKEKVKEKLTDNIKTVVLVNSTGGASGSGTNLWIIRNLLIPYLEKRNIAIISVMILPSTAEGMPQTSNSAYLMSQYYSLSKYISLVPIENDIVYRPPAEGESSFQATNAFIIESLRKILDYDIFLGKPKVGGINTLDSAEYGRIVLPSDGFIVYTKVAENDIDKLSNQLSSFDLNSAKKMIVMFRTGKSKHVSFDMIRKIDNIFPNVVKISSESENENSDETFIEILANGLAIPSAFSINTELIVGRVNSLNEAKKDSKVKNKIAFKNVKGKSLLKI